MIQGTFHYNFIMCHSRAEIKAETMDGLWSIYYGRQTFDPKVGPKLTKSEMYNSLYDIPNISINHSSSSSIVTPASRSQSSAVSKQSAVPKHDWAVQTFSSPTQCMQVSIFSREILFCFSGIHWRLGHVR